MVNQGSCVLQSRMANCQQFSNSLDRCTVCLTGFVLDVNSNCVQVVVPKPEPGIIVTPSRLTNCQQFDNTLGRCTVCIAGYVLDSAFNCVQVVVPKPDPGIIVTPPNPTNPSTQRDINCRKFNGTACILCSNRFYFSPTISKCIPVSTLCKTY